MVHGVVVCSIPGRSAFSPEIMIPLIFRGFRHFWRHFGDFAASARPATVVKSAYFADEARIGRKMTGESSSFDPVWVL